MNPNLDQQPSRNPWPWPNDTAADRARKIARMYRQHLHTLNPAICDQLDQTAAGFGETWMLEAAADETDDDRELTTTQAADLAGTTPKRIREWACTPHPDRTGEMLLPRFKMRGRERTYLAVHVRAAAAIMLARRC